MSIPRALLAALLALPLAAPLGAIDPADLQCPDGGTTLRWESFARPFFIQHCNACHDWTHYNVVYGLRYSLLEMVVEGRMPIGETVPVAERDQLTEFVACDMPREAPSCPPAGTALSWDSFALPFFVSRCGQCHSSSLTVDERNGAPADQNFDDYDTVVKYAPRILEQVDKNLMPPGGWVLFSEADDLREWIGCGASKTASGSRYQRADSNDDGVADLSDVVALLDYLFLGGGLGCLDAADVDGNGGLELTDAVYLLSYLYLWGPAPPDPFYGSCGATLNLGCDSFASCPQP